jgi:hypothetical protein
MITARRHKIRCIDYAPGICCGIDELIPILADIFGGAATGAVAGAGVDAVTGQPITAGSIGESAGLGAAGAGIGGAIGAAGGDAIGAGVGDTTAGIDDVSGLVPGAVPTDTSTISGLASTTGGDVGGAGATTAAIAPSSGATLPDITVTGQSLAGAAPSSGATLPDTVVTGSALGALGAAAGGGGSGVPGSQAAGLAGQTGPLMANNDLAPGAVTDTGPTLNTGGSQFLSADDSLPSVQNLDPSVASSLGIDPIDTSNIGGFGGQIDTSSLDQSLDPDTSTPAGGGIGSGIESWLSNPKNDATAGLLGLSLKNALTKPKLPSADTTAANLATTNAEGASAVINSGGTASPEWASQKASIDATINQQIQQQTQAIMQAAASSGEGSTNSGIVQQQIAQMTTNANTQRQQLYQQAQSQNVQQALSELSGGDSVLTSIGNTQLQQSEEAQALAAQTAELALLLGTNSTVKIPGVGAGT